MEQERTVTQYLQFGDREEAGALLANKLLQFKSRPSTVVLGIPHGGIVVANRIACDLDLPLFAWVVKLIPEEQTAGKGAIALSQGGTLGLRRSSIHELEHDKHSLDLLHQSSKDIDRVRSSLSSHMQLPHDLEGLTVILVDEGAETGSTMVAAVADIKQNTQAKEVVVALPVCSTEAYSAIENQASIIVTLDKLDFPQRRITHAFRNMPAVTDDEVCSLVEQRCRLRKEQGRVY